MRHLKILAVALTLSAAIGPAVAAPQVPTIAAAVAASDRNADNVKMDAGRKPAEVLQFLGLKPGMHVLDLFGGNRYWAEIIAPAVGASGTETVWGPTQGVPEKMKSAFAAFVAKQPNANLVFTPLQSPDFGINRYDFAIFNLNYHDLYGDYSKRGIPQIEPREWLKALYKAMKPGGVVGVIDHVANPGDTRATANSLHRINPETLKADFESVGFVLAGTSDLLRNKADDHTLIVYDPKIRGMTDRVVLKFRKLR